MNPARKQLVWRGDATKTIDLKKNPDKNHQNLQRAMAKLFKNYPSQPRELCARERKEQKKWLLRRNSTDLINAE
jgi:hypothetical protein